MKSLTVIVPVLDEEDILELFYGRLKGVIDELPNTEVIFVDDGSTDSTWNILSGLCKSDSRVKALKLARNFGHQIAVMAGMSEASSDYICIIDADLQDPPELIPEMLKSMSGDTDIVYGLRKQRIGESRFKIHTARIFYKIFRQLVDFDVPVDVGDFRIVTKRAVDIVLNMRDQDPFLRGMFAYTGLNAVPFPYVRDRRYAGVSKYTISKMIRLSVTAMMAFSNKPLKILSKFSLALTCLAVLAIFVSLWNAIIGIPIPGWTSVFIAVSFFGSMNLVMISVVGSYIAKQLEITRNRPKWVIQRRLNIPRD